MTTIPTRREPPAFRRVEVVRVETLTRRLIRVTFGGPELEGLDIGLPAASVRLLLPPTGGADRNRDDVVIPTWNGNEFLYGDSTRPAIRTLTPVRLDAHALELDLEVVVHGHGALSGWASAAKQGDRAAISGTGRGYTIDPSARSYVLAGDETALPAIGVLLASLPLDVEGRVLVEVAGFDARPPLPAHPGMAVEWHELPAGAPSGDALVAAVASETLAPDVRIWAAGEAAAMQRIRQHLFGDRGLPRSRATVRGYWKHGRRSDADED
jgi:NADPH-dependent ferric siderophore reductase